MALGVNGSVGLGDDVGGLALGLGQHVGALLLGLLLGLGDDGLGLAVGLNELVLVALGLLRRLLLGLGSSVKVVLDLLLTLVHHLQDLRPHELGQDDPDDEEGNQRRDELRGLGDEDVCSNPLSQGEGRRRQDGRGSCCARTGEKTSRIAVHKCLQRVPRQLLNDKADDEADEGECLDECRAEDEDREQTALDLRLASHTLCDTTGRQANADASADNAKTITNDTESSHCSSFVIRPIAFLFCGGEFQKQTYDVL